MNSNKPKKVAKPKTSGARMKDLQPKRDAKGGSQKKEKSPLPVAS